MSSSADILLELCGLSKKFCKNLKRGLWYGVQDSVHATLGVNKPSATLRKDEFWAIQDITLSLRKGDILGILGKNGSGKTTLMRAISGIYPFEKGSIEIHGKVSSLFAVTAGMNSLFSGRENIRLRAAMFGMSKAEIDRKMDAIIAFSELEEFIDSPLGLYSSGMRARLGYSVAVATEPDIFIIDEGLAVGDVAFRAKCFEHLREISAHCAVIFISHNIMQIAKVANRAMIMEKGKKIFEDRDVPTVIDQYLKMNVRSAKPLENQAGTTAHIRKLEWLDKTENPEIPHLGKLSFRAEYNIDSAIEHAVGVVQIHDEEQRIVSETRSTIAQFVLPPGEAAVVVELPEVALRPGNYHLSFGLLSADENQFLAMRNFDLHFQVVGYYLAGATTNLKANWK
jgi:lipopolysaccharide transport system ATP-binding protein